MKYLQRMKRRRQVIHFNKGILNTVAAILMLPLYALSQPQLIKEISNKSLGVYADGSAMTNRILTARYNNIIYFIPQTQYTPAGKGRNIYTYDITTGKTDSILIENTKKNKPFVSMRFFSFEVTKDKIVILTDPLIVTLTHSGKKADFLASTKNTKFFNKVKRITDSELFLYVNYNFHPMDAPDKHVWGRFNISKNAIEHITKMEDANAMFSHFMNDWVSMYKGYIAYSRTAEYKITFYNSDFLKTDSIISDKLDSTMALTREVGNKELHSKEDISAFMKQDEGYKRIQKIFLIDSANILVMLKLPKTRNCEFDLWTKKDKWTLVKSEVHTNFYVEGRQYSGDNTPPEGFFGNVNGVINDKNDFYCIYFPFMENINTASFNRKKDYEEKINDMVRKNNLFYGVKKHNVIK